MANNRGLQLADSRKSSVGWEAGVEVGWGRGWGGGWGRREQYRAPQPLGGDGDGAGAGHVHEHAGPPLAQPMIVQRLIQLTGYSAHAV